MRVNGVAATPPAADARLLDYLRDGLGLTGSKEGCGMGECGSCTVLVDGSPVCACLVLAGQVAHSEIVTIEGIASCPGGPAVQDALVRNQAVQCGFCTAGFVVSATAMLAEDDRPDGPDDEEIRASLEGNLCRCTGYGAIARAIRSARG